MCFSIKALISTVSGFKRIDSIKEGEYVLAKDVNNNIIDYKQVKHVYIKSTYEFIHLKLDGEEIRTTASHLFFTDCGWWKAARNLKPGDRILNSKGELKTLTATTVEALQQPEKIYNLNVDQFHTYFVGTNGLLVHNDCTADMAKAFDNAINKAAARGIQGEELVEIGKAAAEAIRTLRYKAGYVDHLKTVISFDRNATKGIVGGHNMVEFKNYFRNVEGLADADFIESIVPHPNFNGIYEITYKVPLKDATGAVIPGQYKIFKNPKTVYDPSVISDADILRWGEEAMRNGIINGTMDMYKITGTASNGLKFEGWINRAVTDATEVSNFYPIIN